MDPYGVLENIENEQETSTGKCSFHTSIGISLKHLIECLTKVLHNLQEWTSKYWKLYKQSSYYSEMVKKGSAQSNRSYELDSAFLGTKEIVTFESRKRKADNSIQIDKMLK